MVIKEVETLPRLFWKTKSGTNCLFWAKVSRKKTGKNSDNTNNKATRIILVSFSLILFVIKLFYLQEKSEVSWRREAEMSETADRTRGASFIPDLCGSRTHCTCSDQHQPEQQSVLSVFQLFWCEHAVIILWFSLTTTNCSVRVREHQDFRHLIWRHKHNWKMSWHLAKTTWQDVSLRRSTDRTSH